MRLNEHDKLINSSLSLEQLYLITRKRGFQILTNGELSDVKVDFNLGEPNYSGGRFGICYWNLLLSYI